MKKKEALFPEPLSLLFSVNDINKFAYYCYRPYQYVDNTKQWRYNPGRPHFPRFSNFG